jgi:signal transduction histidine kinase
MTTQRQGALPGPNIRAIYLTKALAFVVILAAVWLVKWLLSPAILAGPISAIIVLILISTGAVALWRGQVPAWLLGTSFAADIVAITAGIHYGGGVDQVSAPLLYAAVIALAGLLLAERAAFVAAGGSALSYALLVWAEYAKLLPHWVDYGRPPDRQAGTVIMVTLFLFIVAWAIAYTVGQIRRAYTRADEIRIEAIGVLSHDLKNPLAVIDGYAQMIEDEEDPSERLEYVRRIQHSVQQALDLVHNVLDASAMEARPLQPTRVAVHLNELVTQTLQQYRANAASKGIQTSTELATELPVIEADPQLLGRAIGNLISNAVKFTDEGGSVRVKTTNTDQAVLVAVHDTGRGIPAAQQTQLFKKYSRIASARAAEGNGLGLYIVRRIAEAHGGSVRVTSEPGKGSSFTLELPLRAGG